MSDTISRPATEPVAKRVAFAHQQHGDKRPDDYQWLRDRNDPDTLAYLRAENDYAEAATAHLAGLRERLYGEMLGHIKQDDTDAPYPWGGWLYYARTEEGKQYRVYARRRDETAPEQLLLDLNALAAERDYLRLYEIVPSPDHHLLAYTLDTNGYEDLSVRVRDLDRGVELPDQIEGATFGLAWSADGRFLFYVVQDDTKRAHAVMRHEIGSSEPDVLVYREDDDRYSVDLSKTMSGAFLRFRSEGKTTAEEWLLPADQPEGQPWCFAPRRQGIKYTVEDHGDRFFVLTNEDAVNFKLMAAPRENTELQAWSEVLPYRPEINFQSMTPLGEHLVLFGREGGVTRLWVHHFETRETRRVEFDEAVYTIRPGPNKEPSSRAFRFTYTSLVTPETVFDLDLDGHLLRQLKRAEVLGGYDPSDYETRQDFATAPDGTRVPISLVSRKGVLDGGAAPTLLYGYGSYGMPVDPSFNSNRVSLLDRGVVYAIAHIRGGGEMGRPWYENGKFLAKRNTFSDFIACAEHLIARGVTSPGKLAVTGRSAGGLLMGAVLNERPDLFRAAVAGVPFVDVVTTMLDASIPLTTGEWEEWGDPRDPEYYQYMKSYSPYDNVQGVQYPWLLVTTGLNDPRVAFWEPAKWVARLRATRRGNTPLLLKTDLGAGHGGPSGRFDALREVAYEYAFILDALGLAA